MLRMLERALGMCLIALMQLSGGDVFQHLNIIRVAREHAFAISGQQPIVVQIDGGLHQRALEISSLGRVRILLQVALNGVHKLKGAIAGLAEGSLQE
jgi:hypothetical protein